MNRRLCRRNESWCASSLRRTSNSSPAFNTLKRTVEVAETTEEVARTARRIGQDNGLHGRRLDGFVDEAVENVASRRPLRRIAKGSLTDDVTIANLADCL